MAIDIGVLVDTSAIVGYPNITHINIGNPANETGKITQVQMYVYAELSNCEVATFYRPDPVGAPDNLSTRDTHTIGTVVAGSLQSFAVDLDVVEGDYIGIYFTAGYVCANDVGQDNRWYDDGDWIPCTDKLFSRSVSSDCVSIYGTGVTNPTVTIQAVTAILSTTATANGNLTDTGGENATIRGFQYKAENDIKNITGATQANPCNITVVAHGYTTGDEVIIFDVGGMVELNGKTYTITVVDADNFTLDGVDSIAYTAYTSGGTCDKWIGTVLEAEDVGDFGIGAYTKGLTALMQATTYYVRAYAYNSIGYGYSDIWVYFTTLESAPVLTVQSPTDVLPTSVTANGNITATGGQTPTVRGFQYGLTQINTWDVSESGSFGVGAYTKGLTGLIANTTYYIRAYATNSVGTGYSEWIPFQTAATGSTPTGTKLDICSDYSGYTYQLQASETDDGIVYTAYLVISTDLANKQGLAFYKRILDLHLYFKSESSGTALIEVKRDNEVAWQTVGTVSLTGTADIVIPHLAPDIRGKHFLFKISANNYFRFLGVLFQFLKGGLR